jgi:MTH538 TIR-like domain (DUF1863)
MATIVQSNPLRYRAFISYSQRDRHHAKRLHTALETYRVPKGIDVPLEQDRRLGRFFRDDDEMGASTDLGGALRDALEDSENLIVICSPHSARSKWVNAEVLHFKNSGRGDRIFAVVADGTPNSADPESNCFPPALSQLSQEIVNEDLLSGRHAEPLGIHLGKEQFSRARLRLVAGLLRISFDSLWQRDKRRTVKRRAIAGIATLMLVSVIALLGIRWLTERGRVRAQRIDRTLVTVRDDLASERVSAALAELETLTADGEQGPVEEVLKTALSWVSTPNELLKDIKPPTFISNGSQLFFLASNGSLHPFNLHQPYRRVWSSDRRWLLILGADEALMLDVADGREVARTASNRIEWHGEAFETGSGLLIVAGRFSGISNGSHRESFLIFSPQRQTLAVSSVHWDGENRGQYRFIDPMYVSSDCRSFGVISEEYKPQDPTAPPSPSEIFFLSADTNGLKPTSVPDSFSDWLLAAMFDSEHQLGAHGQGQNLSQATGCKAPAADSTRLDTQQGVTGPVRPVGLGTSWEPERRWKSVGAAAAQPAERTGDNNTDPCTEEHKCRVQDAEGEKSFEGLPDRVDITRPRGVPKSDKSFDHVNNEFVYTFATQFNGGFVAAWCRNLNAEVVCLQKATSMELRDEVTDVDLRSATGRFIFYPQGAAQGFRLYDLLTMRNVTPRGPELVASTHWADFSPDDKRLFLTMNGRLLVFEPQPDGHPWQSVSDGGSVQIPALSVNNEDKVAGLLALDDNNLIVVRSSGVIAQFDWRKGQQSWGRTVGNIGEVIRVVASQNRRFLLLIGRAGGRLFDTRDGLVLSGVLVPPPAMDGSTEMFQCFNEAFVTDTGAIEVSCGEKKYQRVPVPFSGDVKSRLLEIRTEGQLIGK